MKRKALITFGLLAFLLGSYGWYEYNRGHTSLKSMTADVNISAFELLAVFNKDEAAANTQFLDKVIKVEGSISAVDVGKNTSLTIDAGDLMSSIVCELAENENIAELEVGDDVNVKGICTGFLSDVILVKCVLDN